MGIAAQGKIDGSEDVSLKIYYRNLGHSPALNLTPAFNAVTAVDPNPKTYEPLRGGTNNTCKGLALKADSWPVFPNSDPTGRSWRETIYPQRMITPAVAASQAALLIQGCFLYETMGETHHTWFCLVAYRNGKFSSEAETPSCEDGNGAD